MILKTLRARPGKTGTRILLALLLFLGRSTSQGQTLYGGYMMGGSNYQGELQPEYFTFRGMRFATGISGMYAFNPYVAVSSELMAGFLGVRDPYPQRNLNFSSHLFELTAGLRINLFYSREFVFNPYVTGGPSLFHVNPFTYDQAGAKYFLYPLSTEGQGLDAYPDRPANRKLNYALNGGGGIELRVSKKIRMDVEVTFRKSFTDYIDDVSSYYPDEQILLAARGPKAVELSYRADELPGYPIEFPSGLPRGRPGTDDWYHSFVIRFRYILKDWALEQRYWNYLFKKRGWPYNQYKKGIFKKK
jgi:hypothetical protein